MTVKRGDHVYGGTIIAEVPETRAITHKVMIPPDLEGDVLSVVSDGEYTINDTLLTIMTKGRNRKSDHYDTEMADPYPASDRKALSGFQTADHRTAYP